MDVDHPRRRIARVREGRVLDAWRSAEGRVGFAVLDVASTAMVSALLNDAFPGARHVDIVEITAVEPVAAGAASQRRSQASGE